MKRIVIFAGTTEGRTLSEGLAARGIAHTVCVATDYGQLMMTEDPLVTVHSGRLDEGEMEDFLREQADRVYDATHPFALVVTENLREACRKTGKEYIRVLREEESGEDLVAGADLRYFPDAEACAAALGETTGNILLTTGSKELHVFTKEDSLADRLYARVLPSLESIGLANEAGLTGKHVIAMHGPFTLEMNRALIRQYDAHVLVTKETGVSGGYPEKIRACAETGTKAFVIGRPREERGISVAEALRDFGAEANCEGTAGTEITGVPGAEGSTAEPQRMEIALIGIGPGSRDLLTGEAAQAIAAADILCGAKRMLAGYEEKTCYPCYLAKDVLPVLLRERPARAAVLFSGDSGFFSGAKKMRTGLAAGLEEAGIAAEIRVLPGISSLSYLAARTGTDYSDARLLSLHGRAGDAEALGELLRELKRAGKVFTLLSGRADIDALCQSLRAAGLADTRMTLGYNLSYPDERIFPVDVATGLATDQLPDGSYVALLETGVPRKRELFPLLGDEEFERSRVPMTKEAIRHLSLARLKLTENAVLYDVGSGTGSIAVQAAALDETIRVYAIEKKEEAADLIGVNSRKHRAPNLTVIRGEAPDALAELEMPTHVFIGGSSGNLQEILACIREKNPSARVVINAVSLETIAEINGLLSAWEREDLVYDLTVEQVQVARSRALGNYHLMMAENPVLIASFTMQTNDLL